MTSINYKLFIYLLLFILLPVYGLSQFNYSIQSIHYQNLNATSLYLGEEDVFGNKFLLFSHPGQLNFPNDTIISDNVPYASVSFLKVDPIGNLLWFYNHQGLAFYNDIIKTNESISLLGRFDDFLSWGNDTIFEENDQGFSDFQYFLVNFSYSGNFKNLNALPKAINEIFDIAVDGNDILITGLFDNFLVYGQDSLIEDSISNVSNYSDAFICRLDSFGNIIDGVNLGSSASEVYAGMDFNPFSKKLLYSGYYFQAPNINPNLSINSLAYILLDSGLNLISSRNFSAPLGVPISSFNYGSKGAPLNFEFNDSIENLFPANNSYSGPQHLGYYKYPNGIMSPTTSGVAFGGSQVSRMGQQFLVDGEVISDLWIHPNGIALNNSDFNNSLFSISIIDMDSLKLTSNVSTNVRFELNSYNVGSQLVSKKITDSLSVIDTISIINNPQQQQYLIANIINCQYFKFESTISKDNDSIGINNENLNVQWYRNNQLIPGANSNKIKLIGSGNYHAELSNYYGCVDYSDTISVVSGINEEEYNSLKVYPNPASSQINFEFSERAEGIIQIFDIRGVKIRSIKIDSKSELLDVSSWNEGVYIYRIENERGVVNGKLLVN
ncbi:T9SS type A sorting domain-containing protein [Hyphobacterium sp. CCMP332]|nr:T9SS type A sorting domain-containing protein [Hyphobacterium sp. CCMP332]